MKLYAQRRIDREEIGRFVTPMDPQRIPGSKGALFQGYSYDLPSVEEYEKHRLLGLLSEFFPNAKREGRFLTDGDFLTLDLESRLSNRWEETVAVVNPNVHYEESTRTESVYHPDMQFEQEKTAGGNVVPITAHTLRHDRPVRIEKPCVGLFLGLHMRGDSLGEPGVQDMVGMIRDARYLLYGVSHITEGRDEIRKHLHTFRMTQTMEQGLPHYLVFPPKTRLNHLRQSPADQGKATYTGPQS